MPTKQRETETVQQDSSAPSVNAQQAPKRTKTPVAMVLKGVHELKVEVAAESDLPTGRSGPSILDDDIQRGVEQVVTKSFETGKWLTIPGRPEAERELIKRVRAAGAKLNYGIRLGNVRVENGQLRVPFLATKRKQYKSKGE